MGWDKFMRFDCTVPYFGFKAKLHEPIRCWVPTIVLCLILDSRQNRIDLEFIDRKLYCALFWIQGKTIEEDISEKNILYCALFWIQGKTKVYNARLDNALYCALFWIQGKTPLTRS